MKKNLLSGTTSKTAVLFIMMLFALTSVSGSMAPQLRSEKGSLTEMLSLSKGVFYGDYGLNVQEDLSRNLQETAIQPQTSAFLMNCLNTYKYGQADAPTIQGVQVQIDECSFAGDYVPIYNAESGKTYLFTSTGGTGNYLTIRQGTFDGPILAEGDSPLSATCTASGSLYLHINTDSSCGTEDVCRITTVELECINTLSYGNVIAPESGEIVPISSCNFAGDYATISGAIAGVQYIFTSTGGTGNYLTIRQGTFDGPILAEGDSPLIASCTSSGNLYMHINTDNSCGKENACRLTAVERISVEPFITEWDTAKAGVSGNNEVMIPAVGDFEYYWENTEDASINGVGNGSGETTITFPQSGKYKIELTPVGINPFNRINFNATGDRMKITKVLQWGGVNWSSFENAFNNCWNLTITASDIPDLSEVTNMQSAFRYTKISTIPNMENWDVSNVTDMSYLFHQSFYFNQPLSNWDVSNVTDMSYMFSETDFNQPIGNWDVSNVTNMAWMFEYSNFNQSIGNWDVSSVTDMSGMFADTPFNKAIGNWDVSNVTDMSYMFSETYFNQSIGNWNVSSVTDMSRMFVYTPFNKAIGNWDVSNVTSMRGMFTGAENFNQPLSNWDVSNVTNMWGMFSGAKNFNQPLSNWDVSNVTSMRFMFAGTEKFDQYLNWDVSSVTDMSGMFSDALKFNSSISGDFSSVTDMSYMFDGAESFNPWSLDYWDVSSVTNMSYMFRRAEKFNADIGNWNVSNVTNMTDMFYGTEFNQSLANWNLKSLTGTFSLEGDMSCENLSYSLYGWANNPETNSGINFSGGIYSLDIQNEVAYLVDTLGWSVTSIVGSCHIFPGYNISLSSNPVIGGTTVGTGHYEAGSEATVTATANPGYVFENWQENGAQVSTDASYTFTVTADRVLVANFSGQNFFTINATTNPSEAGSVSGIGQYQEGSEATVTATANPGYVFKRWQENGVVVSTDPSYSFTVTGDRNLVAKFALDNGGGASYTIKGTPYPAAGGSVTGAGTYSSGTQITMKAVANTGFVFKNWTEGGVEVATTKNYKFTVSSNRNLKANFEKPKYNIITKSFPAAGGTTSGDGEYLNGKQLTVKAVANPGYVFVNWTEGNTVVATTKNYKFTVSGKRTLKANFEKATYTITTKVTPGVGGTTTGDGTYAYGSNITVQAEPSPGYAFVEWLEGDTNVSTKKKYKFTVSGKRTLKAKFVKLGASPEYARTTPTIEKLMVYPNPFDDKLMIKSDSRHIEMAVLYDLSGSFVKEQKFAEGSDYIMNTSGLKKGIYLLKLFTENGVETHKVIKK